ncbi:dTDP-4-dehydrorhamnose reductase [Sporomusa sp.]|uniref:dTDP-4-dehydrorhamnose reductase n=1 Tax=Sporomusa sp. TaxID=2078658 RepID=UPI002CFDA874|nr:dTDP-4-dehydrorhamnose reductase [Sporomusa sp.]HWR41618.1 dTDP-4-dehydrorhamnose reductase [Sporomusa sp.]
MKIIVTGGTGQLGRAFADLSEPSNAQILCLSSREMDVTNPHQVNSVFNQVQPDVVIHAGAYTAVDAAEKEADAAFRVNVVGTRNIAAACLHYHSKLVYISTDYVFDGKYNRPYTEFDQTNPLNVYGRSKLEGEKIAARICPQLFIIRTSWLYGEGHNFVRTILRLAKEREYLTIVNDQTGSPTYTADLAQGILSLVDTHEFGTYHMSNNGQCTWYEFAKEILRLAGRSIEVKPITTAEFAMSASRPQYSVLRNYMLELTSGDYFRSWQEGLNDYINKIVK